MARKIRDEDLLPLMLSGKSQVAIAEELGVTRAAVCNRVNDPDFVEVLAQYRRRILDNIVTDLTSSAQKCVATLEQLLDDDSSSIRLSAASKILSLVQDYSIQHDLLRTVDRIDREREDLYTKYNRT